MDLVCVACRLRARERRELAAHLPPGHAVSSGLSPDVKAGRLATLDQCLLQGAPPRHQRGPFWPGVCDETCKQLPWKPIHGHARHVARPAGQTAAVVLFHSGDAEVKKYSRITPQVHRAGRQAGAIKPVRRADWEWAASLPQPQRTAWAGCTSAGARVVFFSRTMFRGLPQFFSPGPLSIWWTRHVAR